MQKHEQRDISKMYLDVVVSLVSRLPIQKIDESLIDRKERDTVSPFIREYNPELLEMWSDIQKFSFVLDAEMVRRSIAGEIDDDMLDRDRRDKVYYPRLKVIEAALGYGLEQLGCSYHDVFGQINGGDADKAMEIRKQHLDNSYHFRGDCLWTSCRHFGNLAAEVGSR